MPRASTVSALQRLHAAGVTQPLCIVHPGGAGVGVINGSDMSETNVQGKGLRLHPGQRALQSLESWTACNR